MLKRTGLLGVCVSFVFLAGASLFAEEPAGTLQFRVAVDDEQPGWKQMELPGTDAPIFVSSEAALDGDDIEKVSFYNDSTGNPVIGLTLTDDGAQAMEATTSQNFKKKLAILLNGKVVAAPIIQATISKDVQISGPFDRGDLLSFFHAIVLREVP